MCLARATELAGRDFVAATKLTWRDFIATTELTGWDFVPAEGELGTCGDGQGKAIENGFHGKLLRGNGKDKATIGMTPMAARGTSQARLRW